MRNNVKKFCIVLLLIIFFPIKSFCLIEVDITRGNLNPLPLAVSPLSIDDNSKKSFKNILKKENIGLSLSEEDALKAQIFGCWSIPLGLPYNENLLVRIKLQLNPDGTVSQSEILDHARMNKPGQGF